MKEKIEMKCKCGRKFNTTIEEVLQTMIDSNVIECRKCIFLKFQKNKKEYIEKIEEKIEKIEMMEETKKQEIQDIVSMIEKYEQYILNNEELLKDEDCDIRPEYLVMNIEDSKTSIEKLKNKLKSYGN